MQRTLIHYLEMTNANQLKKKSKPKELEVQESKFKDYRLNKFFYQYVGEVWNWKDKLVWTNEQWKNYAEREELKLWIATVEGTPAGYFELEMQTQGNVELAYFGLAPNFIGKGYGAYLLSVATKQAWQLEGTKRVWVHTCTDDHPQALANYQSRGFKQYKTEEDTTPNSRDSRRRL